MLCRRVSGKGSGMKRACLAVVLATLALTASAFGGLMAVWDFGPDKPGFTLAPATYRTMTAPVLELRGGDIDADGKDGTAYTDSMGVEHVAGQAAAWDDVNKAGTSNDAALWITLDTRGWSDLAMRFDYRSEEAISFDLDYRTGSAGAWQQIRNNQPISAGWQYNSFAIDLSGFPELAGQAMVQILLSDLDEGPGNDRFVIDNLEFTGIPEPASVVLLGLGAVLAVRRRVD